MKLSMNLDGTWKANDRYWTFCIGSGHAALALRNDYQQLLRQVSEELGFQRVRFHGIFNDDMQVVVTFHDLLKVWKSRGVKTVSFYQIGVVFDALLEMGIRPFIEIGFMPSAFAKKKKRVFYYKGNISQPKDEKEWSDFIEQFITFLKDRYGEKEVSNWFFEIWNEPDLKGFFWTGSQKDYFYFYKNTVQAIRRVLPKARVGGPATSQNRWIKEFQEFCEQQQVPLDFISTHHYPGDDIGLPIFTLENAKRLLFTASKHQGKTVHEVFHKMMVRDNILPLIKKDSMYRQIKTAHDKAKNYPLYYTEWNVNPTCTNELHDTCASASFIIKHVLDGQYMMEGCSFFTFSDIFEENTFYTQPFSGSFGLVTIHGIPKPSYWAFHFLNRLGENRLLLPVTHDKVEYAVFKKGKVLQILMYMQSFIKQDDEEITLQLPIRDSKLYAKYWSINETDTNPKRLWEDMGSPAYLSKADVEQIKENSKPKERTLVFNHHGSMLEGTITMHHNEVILMEIIREEGKKC